MEIQEGVQECKEHQGRIINSVCLDKPCPDEALMCNRCVKEKHKSCTGRKSLDQNDIKKRVNIIKFNRNKEELKNLIKEHTNKHKQAFNTKFDIPFIFKLFVC